MIQVRRRSAKADEQAIDTPRLQTIEAELAQRIDNGDKTAAVLP
jgi:hypothetical protein